MKTLQEIIENRESIGHQIEAIIAGPASSWGITIESILIKDMIFESELQETLAAAAYIYDKSFFHFDANNNKANPNVSVNLK